MVKSFAKNETLLSVHLSNTPEIRRVKLLQSYIRAKLRMNAFLPKRKKTLPYREMIERKLRNNWMEQDKIRETILTEENALQYYDCQRSESIMPGEGEPLVIQRVIGFPSMKTNEKWLARRECYVCGRYQMSCFIHSPDPPLGAKNPTASYKQRQKDVKKHFMTGSFDSLSYGEVKPGKTWKGLKMMRITDFLQQYDSTFVREEDYIKHRIIQI